MSVPAKLAGFAALLAVVFVVGLGLGRATEPDPAPAGPATTMVTPTTMMPMDHGS